MNACPNLVVLFCLVGVGISVTESAVAPLTTPNPECPGMHRLAKSLEKGLASYTQEVTNCRVNKACTGLMCNGTHEKNDFYMKLELKHCNTPPSIHLDLIYKKINIHQEMQEGQPIQISSKKLSGVPAPIKLKLTLKRNRNKITTGLEVQVCPLLQCKTLFTLLQPTTFCVNMKTCRGYNSTGDVPCHLNPTTIPTHESANPTHSSEPVKTASTSKVTAKSSSSTLKPRPYSPTRHSEPVKTASTAKITAKSSSSTLKPRPYSSTRHSEPVKTASAAKVTTKVSSSTLKPRPYSSTRHSGTTAGPGDTSALKKGSGGHHGVSTGLAIGIAFACIVGILVIIGAVIYWKKFYRRSRLRAAYYNDISMNDPLYEDFGPEVA